MPGLFFSFERDDKIEHYRVKNLARGKAVFGAGAKKTLAGSGKGFFVSVEKQPVGSAAGTSAGTGTATAAATEGVSGSDGETGAISSFNEIDLNGPASFQQILVHQKFQATFLKYLIAVFWLIQSQAKGGPASPTLHQSDADGGTDLVLLQIGF